MISLRLWCIAGAFFSLGSLFIHESHAAPIPIVNHSFEDDVFDGEVAFIGDGTSFDIPGITGWHTRAGLLHPDFGFNEFYIGGLIKGDFAPDGGQWAWLGSDDTGDFLFLSQNVGTVAADTIYTLEVAVINRADAELPTFPPGTWEIGLYTGEPVYGGGTLIARLTGSDLGAVNPGDNSSADNVLVWDSTGSPFGGQQLWIALGSELGAAGGQVGFDNVRLEAVPEPNALALLIVGSAVCGLVARKKSWLRK